MYSMIVLLNPDENRSNMIKVDEKATEGMLFVTYGI